MFQGGYTGGVMVPQSRALTAVPMSEFLRGVCQWVMNEENSVPMGETYRLTFWSPVSGLWHAAWVCEVALV